MVLPSVHVDVRSICGCDFRWCRLAATVFTEGVFDVAAMEIPSFLAGGVIGHSLNSVQTKKILCCLGRDAWVVHGEMTSENCSVVSAMLASTLDTLCERWLQEHVHVFSAKAWLIGYRLIFRSCGRVSSSCHEMQWEHRNDPCQPIQLFFWNCRSYNCRRWDFFFWNIPSAPGLGPQTSRAWLCAQYDSCAPSLDYCWRRRCRVYRTAQREWHVWAVNTKKTGGVGLKLT